MTFAMAGRNGLSIELIKPTGEQVIVSSLPSSILRTYICTMTRSRVGFIPGQARILTGFFFNRFGCLFYREDHVHFHIIHSFYKKNKATEMEKIGHLHDVVSLLLRPELFSFFLSYLIMAGNTYIHTYFIATP